MNAPANRSPPEVEPLRTEPCPQVAAWTRRLGKCATDSTEARSIYREAIDTGLRRELCDTLRAGAAADRCEAQALKAEADRRFP